MTTGNENGRTHEPSLRETVAELDGLREAFRIRIEALENLAAERDKWYSERDRDRSASVDKALTAAKEQTASSFAASKEAILKAEEGQRSYNTSHNDLSRKMEEQYKSMLPRAEAFLKWDSSDKEISEARKEIAGLRESRSASGGHSMGEKAMWGYVVGAVGLILAVLSIAGLIVAFAR